MLAKKSLEWTCKVCKKTNQEIADKNMLAENDAQAEEELKRAGVGMPQLSLTSETQKLDAIKKLNEDGKDMKTKEVSGLQQDATY